MEVFSYLGLVLLSLVGFSSGAVVSTGSRQNLKPQIYDLIIVVVVWGGALYSRSTLDLNKWMMILVWLVIGFCLGILTRLLRRTEENRDAETSEPPAAPPFPGAMGKWLAFSRRMGNFQSRILLSLMFFILITPFALLIKIFSDPLSLKFHEKSSFWHPKKKLDTALDRFRRQF